MDIVRPESCAKRKRAINELEKGREFANQLQILLNKPFENHGSVSAEELANKIVRSFSETLSVMSSCQIRSISDVGSDFSGDRISQDSGESRKKGAVKNCRGRYKRRKASESRVKISPVAEDGYAWRKYGQKEILDARYPRCYFRCTHKYDRGCQALKQVQKIEEDHNMYQITYFGHHTCKDTLNSPKPFSNSQHCMLSFQSNKQDQSITPSLKQEEQSELSDNMSPLDSTIWQDLMALESTEPSLNIMGSDHEDMLSSVHSCGSASSHGLDMESIIRSVAFQNDFQFGEIGYF